MISRGEFAQGLLSTLFIGIIFGLVIAGTWSIWSSMLRRTRAAVRRHRAAQSRRKHEGRKPETQDASNGLTNFQRPIRQPSAQYRFEIKQLRFDTGVGLSPSRITVFVGPNNSGKSFALKVLHSALTGGSVGPVFSDITVATPKTMVDFHDSYGTYLDLDTYSVSSGYHFSDEMLSDEPTFKSQEIDSSVDKWLVKNDAIGALPFLKAIGPIFVNRVPTESRIVASSTQERSARESGLLATLYFAGRATERALSNIVHATFGLRTRLDDSTAGEWSIRISDNFVDIPLDAMEARRRLGRLPKLEWQGDGLRSFVTVVINLLIGRRPILLIDEPEAFLHPSQAFALGRLLGKSEPVGGNQFIATHSANLLRGILNGASGASDVTLVRLTRYGERYKQSILDSQYFSSIVNDPLLGSSGFVEGLFYPGILVFEGNSDRVLIEFMSRRSRLLDEMLFLAGLGVPSALRIHVAYSRLTIPSVVLLDCDVLLEHDILLEAVSTLSPSRGFSSQVSILRQDIVADVNANREQLKRYGRRALSNRGAEKFDELHRLLRTLGIVINPAGELEGSLAEAGMNYSTDKRRWIEDAVKYVALDEPKYDRDPWRLLELLDESMRLIAERYAQC